MSRLAILVVLSACADAPLELADMPCADGTSLRYDTFGAAFMARHCNSCHSGARAGAPSAYRFDTHADVQRHAARIFVRAAGPNVTMPPGPSDPSADERDQLAEWLACGAP